MPEGAALAQTGEKMETPEINEAVQNVADALVKLGLNEANTNMGGLELLSKEIKEASERIAEGLESVASAICQINA